MKDKLLKLFKIKKKSEIVKQSNPKKLTQKEVGVLCRELESAYNKTPIQKRESFLKKILLENFGKSFNLRQDKTNENIKSQEIADSYEGTKREGKHTYYERDPKLRTQSIKYHGTTCKVCGFNFEKFYGKHGKDYIEVHHLKLVSRLGRRTRINVETDMTVVCSNCHSMIHRDRNKFLTIEELREMIEK